MHMRPCDNLSMQRRVPSTPGNATEEDIVKPLHMEMVKTRSAALFQVRGAGLGMDDFVFVYLVACCTVLRVSVQCCDR